MVTNGDKKMPKKCQIFYCDKCNFECSKSSNYVKHKATAKHKMVTNGDSGIFLCDCGKRYAYRQGLSRHKRSCTYENEIPNSPNELLMILEEHKEEQRKRDEEHKQQMNTIMEQMSSMSLVTNNTTNNKFNLNFFLNTQCKDAIDYQTFLESIVISDKDLVRFEKDGYLNGMMDVIQRSLYSLDIHQRPIHCTDVKRQTVYFKNKEGNWKKDGEKRQLERLVDTIENKTHNYFMDEWINNEGLEGTEHVETDKYKWYLKVTTEITGGEHGKKDINQGLVITNVIDGIHVKKNNSADYSLV
jgi:hypothetical protein